MSVRGPVVLAVLLASVAPSFAFDISSSSVSDGKWDKKFVADNTPAGIQTEVRVLSWGPAIMVNPDHPAIHVAAQSFRDVLGKETVFIRSGAPFPSWETLRSTWEFLPSSWVSGFLTMDCTRLMKSTKWRTITPGS